MSKTKFRIADCKDIFLYRTRVENLFINEFLPGAPGEYVKLYLFALMYAQYDEEIDTARLARSLAMEEFEVEEGWAYWEARGLVQRSRDGTAIEFLSLIDRFYGRDKDMMPSETEEEETGQDLMRRQLRMLLSRLQEVSGRTLSRKETEKITDALTLFDIKPEVLYYAIDYCADIDNTNVDYITKVALRWKEEGCEDRAAVKALLEKHSERNIAYREVFRAVGFNRLTTPADREIMDRWFDEMGCSLDEVLQACRATGGIREPSLRYVSRILENRALERGGIKAPAKKDAGEGTASASSGRTRAKVSRKVLRDYYEHIREEAEQAQAARMREAMAKAPGIEEVLEAEQALSSEMASLMTGPDARSRREQLKEKRRQIQERKSALLAAAGYPADFLDRRYRCNICQDTGYTDEGTVCTCCRARADEAYIWIREKDKA